MASDASQETQESVPLFLVENDFLNFTETTDGLLKIVEDIREVIQCRTNIFMQKKEKHQQVLDYQMMKLDNERKEYLKKSETVMNEMREAKSQLMQIEHSYFNMRNKLNSEKQSQKALQERIKQLQLDSKRKNAKFYETSELYNTVMSWYKDLLNIGISLDKENQNIVTVTFKETKKDFKGYPHVKIQILDNNKFQILKTHPSLEEHNDITKQLIQRHEITVFLQKFRKQFLSSG